MLMTPIALVVAAAASALGGLRDKPIGASQVQYLDSSASNTWSAATASKIPAGCVYHSVSTAHVSLATSESRTLTDVQSREECCERCWAEGLCASSLHSNIGKCLLQTADEARATLVVDANADDDKASSWMRCERVRADAPPLDLRIPATVPGDLISDLQAAGQIGDPWYEKTFLNSSLWNDHVWNYSLAFTVNPAVHALVAEQGHALLVFDGIKMGARISLDGKDLGTATDQFLRYEYDVTDLVHATSSAADAATHTLTVSFDPSIDVGGRFAACTGGWDWAPYSHTYLDGAHTFSKGLWKSVYLAATAKASVAIAHVVPQISYRGAYPTERLVDGQHAGFTVEVRVHLLSHGATHGSLRLSTSWKPGLIMAERTVALPAGPSNVTLRTTAGADEIALWWPNGLGGARPLYNLSVTFAPAATAGEVGATSGAERGAAPLHAVSASASTAARGAGSSVISATRTVGFRYVALVTGNDTDPSYVAHAQTTEGTHSHGLYFRVNGVPLWAKGANVIPMEELEGRLDTDAHRLMVEAAVGGRFNMLRVWGGGMFLPDAFYDACDVNGLLVYHDMQYAQSGHAPEATDTQTRELRHAIRRLASHPSIAVWDGCNECRVVMNTTTGIYASFVMTVVAQEDASRAVWPSCPALGWTKGVRTLDAIPNGRPLITPPRGHAIETHGPYMHGTGFPAVNGNSALRLFTPLVPITVDPHGATGLGLPNVFASEFGSAVMSSFESMAPTLAPEHWGLHAGQPDDTCTGRFSRTCKGVNVMAERNYPCDNIIDVYFGKQPAGYFNRTGEAVFKKQLYQCMLSQALHMKGDIEARRGKNQLGLLVWQFNEIWPTGGWGSIEYGTPVTGQVLGGRWKPLHYLYRRSLLADVMATCGSDGWCYVRNDQPGAAFVGTLDVVALEFATGKTTVVVGEKPLQMASGPGVSARFQVDLSGVGGRTHMLIATVTPSSATDYAESGKGADGAGAGSGAVAAPISVNEILISPPSELQLPPATVHATVAEAANADGSIDVQVQASATALYVNLATLAHGRFSDNAFAMAPGVKTIQFLPLGSKPDVPALRRSLRVEHMQPYLL